MIVIKCRTLIAWQALAVISLHFQQRPVVATHKPKDAIAEYMRRRMHQITTQVGECYRPNLKKPCPTVNACGRSEHWLNTIDDLPFLVVQFCKG